MSRKSVSISAVAVFVAFTVAEVAQAVILVNDPLTNTSQIRTATNNPYFTGVDGFQADVVGVNFRYSGASAVPSGFKLHGVGFDNITISTPSNATPLPAGPFNLVENPSSLSPTLTLDSSTWTGSDNTPRGAGMIATGADASVLNTIGTQVFFLRTTDHPSIGMKFDGLSPNTRVYVQAIGGDNFGGANQSYAVTANGNFIGNWTSVDNTPNAGGLLGFESITDSLGTLDLNFAIVSGSAGGFAGIMVSEQLAIPEPSSLLLLGFGALALVHRSRRRQANA